MNTLTKQSKAINNFKNLIAPHTLEHFSKKYWDKKPLVIERNDKAYFQSLLTIAQIDDVLNFCRPKGNSLRVVKNQEPLNKTKYENTDGSLNLNQLYAAYADGYTIVINELERFWEPLKLLCANVNQLLSHKTVANMYLTPKHQKALLPHYDSHDVFVLQLEGKKHWKLYDPVYETPLVNSFQPVFKREQLQNEQNITLNAGDMMYIPRGVPHEAATTDASSLHLTIGVYAVQWIDFITQSIEVLAQTNKGLRESLPIGYLNNLNNLISTNQQEKLTTLLNNLFDQQNNIATAGKLSETFRIEQHQLSDGHFSQLDNLDSIGLETNVCHRIQANCTTLTAGNAARILFRGNVVKGPAHIAPALNFITQHKEGFLIKDIPHLNDQNKVKLIQRLIRGGLLKITTNK